MMIAYSPASTPWRRCGVCLPHPSPRVVPISDPALCRKHPGKPRTKAELIEDGADPAKVKAWRRPVAPTEEPS
jgi:hypothetical protein